ncbi:MAG: hypothetical protein KDB79_15880 [Acidobacteria bacterium]|nr:hypothetical protein [Acidobacteriota bacterium]
MESDIENIFNATSIKYINLRNSKFGGFITRIERKT